MAYIIAIGAYLLALMIFGLVVAHKKVKTSDDMVTGGHRIPFIVLVGTLLATWCGGGGITGSASVVYTGGPWVGLLTFAAPPIGIILLYFIAGKVRKSNKVTVPEIMEARYGKAASIISALCVMLAYVGVLATQLKAAADIIVLLCSSSGVEISHGLALTICTVIIAVITVGGGLFGFLGMLLGVPVFATLYMLISDFTERALRKQGKPIQTKAYFSIRQVADLPAGETGKEETHGDSAG